MTTLTAERSTVAPPPPPFRTRRPRVTGVLLIVVGLILLVAQAGLLDTPWPVIPAVLLVFAGIAVAVEALRGVWHDGLVTLGVILTVIAGLSITARTSWDVPFSGAGNRTVAPATAAELQEQYELGVGNLRLDLTDVNLLDRTTAVAAEIGVGELSVRVPEGLAVAISADSTTGDIVLFGETRNGIDVHHDYTSPGYAEASRRLDLDLKVGMGRIEVTR